MFAFLSAPENIVFVSALVLMLLLGIVQAVGLAGDADFDAPDWLDWLGFGRVPLLVVIVLLLASFGLIGLLGQQLARDIFGILVPGWIAVPGAGVLALPATALSARLLAPILPQDHTTAIDVDDLVGSGATILTGRATTGSPARARVEDWHGQAHYLMVEPDNAGQVFEEGERVLLVRREGDVFRAIAYGDHHLPRLGI
ncbi:MAG: YqiJ family protein [Sphingomonas sp.]